MSLIGHTTSNLTDSMASPRPYAGKMLEQAGHVGENGVGVKSGFIPVQAPFIHIMP